MPKFYSLLAALIFAAPLAGCIDANQDLVVTPDGQADLHVELSMDAAMLTMMKSAENPPDYCTESAFHLVEGLAITVEEHAEKGDIVCNAEISGPIEAIAANMSNPYAGLPTTDQPAPFKISFAREGENFRFQFNGQFEGTPAPVEGQPDMSQMMLAMVAGRSINWSITAPTIIETSGTLSADGKTATYSVPLALALDPNPQPLEFHVMFSDR